MSNHSGPPGASASAFRCLACDGGTVNTHGEATLCLMCDLGLSPTEPSRMLPADVTVDGFQIPAAGSFVRRQPRTSGRRTGGAQPALFA